MGGGKPCSKWGSRRCIGTGEEEGMDSDGARVSPIWIRSRCVKSADPLAGSNLKQKATKSDTAQNSDINIVW